MFQHQLSGVWAPDKQACCLWDMHALFTRIDSASSHLVIALFTPYNLDNHLATRTAIIACLCQTRGGPDSNHDAHVHAGVHASRTTRNNRGGRPWSACGWVTDIFLHLTASLALFDVWGMIVFHSLVHVTSTALQTYVALVCTQPCETRISITLL